MTLLYTTDLGSQANNQRNKVYSWDFWLSVKEAWHYPLKLHLFSL